MYFPPCITPTNKCRAFFLVDPVSAAVSVVEVELSFFILYFNFFIFYNILFSQVEMPPDMSTLSPLQQDSGYGMYALDEHILTQ